MDTPTSVQYRCITDGWARSGTDLPLLLTELPEGTSTYTVSTDDAGWTVSPTGYETRHGSPPSPATAVLLCEAAGVDTGEPVQTCIEARACWFLAGAAMVCATASTVDAAALDVAVRAIIEDPSVVLEYLPPPAAACWSATDWDTAAAVLRATGSPREQRLLERFAPRCFPVCFPAPPAAASVDWLAVLVPEQVRRSALARVAVQLLG
jgi:hypothetical protein